MKSTEDQTLRALEMPYPYTCLVPLNDRQPFYYTENSWLTSERQTFYFTEILQSKNCYFYTPDVLKMLVGHEQRQSTVCDRYKTHFLSPVQSQPVPQPFLDTGSSRDNVYIALTIQSHKKICMLLDKRLVYTWGLHKIIVAPKNQRQELFWRFQCQRIKVDRHFYMPAGR